MSDEKPMYPGSHTSPIYSILYPYLCVSVIFNLKLFVNYTELVKGARLTAKGWPWGEKMGLVTSVDWKH
jgi:hypothetical protein